MRLERYFAAILAVLRMAPAYEVEVLADGLAVAVAVSEVLDQRESSVSMPNLVFDLNWRTW